MTYLVLYLATGLGTYAVAAFNNARECHPVMLLTSILIWPLQMLISLWFVLTENCNMGINNSTLFGNLVRDPELKFSQGGLAIVTGSVATNRWRKDKDDYVSYLDFKIFGKRGEAFASNHAKGDKVLLVGYPEQERWEDKNGGGKRSKVVFVIDSFEFVRGDKASVNKSQPSF